MSNVEYRIREDSGHIEIRSIKDVEVDGEMVGIKKRSTVSPMKFYSDLDPTDPTLPEEIKRSLAEGAFDMSEADFRNRLISAISEGGAAVDQAFARAIAKRVWATSKAPKSDPDT